ncbi:MAG: multiubiquitin domain-containing protein [Actinomycetia bacterium]|nr:multiubiquitin domain-containing protein [Actinomycetes bacterium]
MNTDDTATAEPNPDHADKASHARHDFKIVVNLREVRVDHDVLTFEEVVALAPNLPDGQDVTFTVTYTDAKEPRQSGTLTPGHTVRIKNGTTFNVRATRKS